MPRRSVVFRSSSVVRKGRPCLPSKTVPRRLPPSLSLSPSLCLSPLRQGGKAESVSDDVALNSFCHPGHSSCAPRPCERARIRSPGRARCPLREFIVFCNWIIELWPKLARDAFVFRIDHSAGLPASVVFACFRAGYPSAVVACRLGVVEVLGRGYVSFIGSWES